ncbi:hypothetical protein [Pedobacter cryophilus]|uniref:Uncharacterized protein n=1 Tax=Pedobacter cryophilus TaxID=2571271 RepID=A0A4U1C1Q4_9SPHI|nr:hypothetical protein [Pedobacter cryophilus]TKB98917.1 hypothetical protein FA046_07320 [Pedobacter cryophilus]
MEEKDIYTELSSIRNLMERSTKFISLSGLSGILAGIYALIGAFMAYKLVYQSPEYLGNSFTVSHTTLVQLLLIALGVLIFSICTGIWLTMRQAEKKGKNPWNPVSRRLIHNMAIPLLTGGMFILILLYKGQFGILASASLIFYGLALISASHYTFSDIKWLGICEIVLGLLAVTFQGYGILFWALGFGVLHILYGSIMHFKYKQ